jgi:LacI family transcriptional regulator
MRDVAERAAVSVTTVSHVINQTRPVSEDLQERVHQAMRELGYQPNALARSLRRRETYIIGLILPDSADPFFAEVARGIEDTCFERGYSIILCNSDSEFSKELLYTNLLAEKQVDGLLFLGAGHLGSEHIHSLQARQMPVVVVDRHIPGAVVDTVLVDNAHGGWLATHHLVELGHRRIGCLTGPSHLSLSAERVTGYRQALAETGCPIDDTLILKGDFQYESGYRAASYLLSLEKPPTAIFACNDLMAIGVINAGFELGRPVPGQLSVVGFDDIRLAAFTNPPLTTVAQPKYKSGVLATELLLERIQRDDIPPRRQLLETQLVVRRSTAPPTYL